MIYDIVGDIHGYSNKLIALLTQLGYQKKQGVWQSSERTLVSVGDLIDRGPGQKETVDIIRGMHEAGHALVIQGNHEYNALGWVKQTNAGDYFRKHTKKNRAQHLAFLKLSESDPAWYQSTLEWFEKLPIYLELPGFRVIHACWHEPSLELIKPYLTMEQALKPEIWEVLLDETHPKNQSFFDALEILLKGWELPLPEGCYFVDGEQNKRFRIRTKWWLESEFLSYRQAALSVPNLNDLPEQTLGKGGLPGYSAQKPLFFGHYWMRGAAPKALNKNIACVDWTVVPSKNTPGKLVAYSYQGETVLKSEHFTWVEGF